MEIMERKGAKYTMFKVAILSLSTVLCSVAVMAAIVSSLAQDYPDASLLELQGFINIPVIGGMIATLVGGALAPKVGKKNLCLIGFILCFIGGLSPMFIPSLIGKTIVRVIAGFGVGLIQPLSASLIVDCFEGKEANSMMGIQSATVGLGATIFSTGIAMIMAKDWHMSFLIYLLVLIPFVLVLIFVPNSVNKIGASKNDAGEKVAVSKLPASAYFTLIAQVIYSIGYGFIAINLSLGAVETGTISPVDCAAIMSIGSVAALVGGFIFGPVKNVMGMKVGYLSLILQAVGFILFANTASFAMWVVATVLVNLGFCRWMPYINFLANEETDATNSAKATSYAFFGNSIGSFIAAYVFAAIGGLVGGSCWKSFDISAVIMVITIVMIAVFTTVHKVAPKPEGEKH
jgi:MFS family permease